jgi:hypothetical protein
VLRRKATDLGIPDIDARITQQNLLDFCYTQRFAAVLIPASSIMMLSTQASQIACLRRVYDCLEPEGRLLLNFHIPSYTEDLLLHQDSPVEEEFGDFIHPEAGTEIGVTYSRICNLSSQTENYTWLFRCDGERAEVPMQARWIFTEEFESLLRMSGFVRWELYGSPDCEPYVASAQTVNTYWSASK